MYAKHVLEFFFSFFSSCLISFNKTSKFLTSVKLSSMNTSIHGGEGLFTKMRNFSNRQLIFLAFLEHGSHEM